MTAERSSKAGRSYVVHPNVSRFDYPEGRGGFYRVRFSRRDDQGAVSTKTKTFTDAVYGKRRGRALAIEWRENYAKNLKAQRSPRAQPPGYWYVKKMRVSNNSQGVRHHYLAYVAFLRIEDRKHLSTRWSIEKWGDIIAKRRCEAWVKKKRAELNARLNAGKHDAPKSKRASSLPAPLIRLTKNSCKQCGGSVFKMTGPGRHFEYRPHVKGPIPSDFPTNTCGTCGEHYLTAAAYEALCNLMLKQESLAPKKTARRSSRSQAA